MFPNHRGDHGGFGPGADSHGPGFRDDHFDPHYGHEWDDHMDAGLNFHEDDRWDWDDDRDALGNHLNFFD
jgi:hypothetical protein